MVILPNPTLVSACSSICPTSSSLRGAAEDEHQLLEDEGRQDAPQPAAGHTGGGARGSDGRREDAAGAGVGDGLRISLSIGPLYGYIYIAI